MKKENSLTFSLADEFVCAAKNPSERYHSLQQTDFTTNWILLCRSFFFLFNIIIIFIFLPSLPPFCYVLLYICIYLLNVSCLSVCLLGVFNGFMGFLIHCGSERKNQQHSMIRIIIVNNKEGDCRQILYNKTFFFSSFNFIVIYDL